MLLLLQVEEIVVDDRAESVDILLMGPLITTLDDRIVTEESAADNRLR